MAIDLGINLLWCVDYDPEKLPANLIHSGRPWSSTGNADATGANWTPVDAKGWPQVTPGTPFGSHFERRPWPGVYKLSFTNRNPGTGDNVRHTGGGTISIGNRVHNNTTNVTTYDVTVGPWTDLYDQYIILMWDGLTGGITDASLMRPLKDASGWHTPGTILSDHIIDRLAWFSTIRVMQTQNGANEQQDVAWTERVLPWSIQTQTQVLGRACGASYEWLVAAANQANKNIWFCVPFFANDDYITKMAQVILYGSNGFYPYTGPYGSGGSNPVPAGGPVFPGLNPNLKVYIEYSNEIWNYTQSRNNALAASEIAAGDPNHYTYTSGDTNTYGLRRIGYKIKAISDAFRAVWGDAAMGTRVLPVLAGQHGNYATLNTPLEYIRDVWGTSNPYGHAGHPITYYLDSISTAPYVPSGNDAINTATPSTIIDGSLSNFYNRTDNYPGKAIEDNAARARLWGLKYTAYEGGDNLVPSLMPGGATASTIQKTKLASYCSDGAGTTSADRRMGVNLVNGVPAADQSQYVHGSLFKTWQDNGGDMFAYFVLGETAWAESMFGLGPPTPTSTSDTRVEDGPKWDAIKAYALTPRSPDVDGPTATLDNGVPSARQALPPHIYPAAGTYIGSRTVYLTALSKGSIIRYTTDGSTPTLASTRYTGPFTVASSATVKAVAFVKNRAPSRVSYAAYVIQ